MQKFSGRNWRFGLKNKSSEPLIMQFRAFIPGNGKARQYLQQAFEPDPQAPVRREAGSNQSIRSDTRPQRRQSTRRAGSCSKTR